jgi:hypothetical protein
MVLGPIAALVLILLVGRTALAPSVESVMIEGDSRLSTGIDISSPPHLNITKSVSHNEIWQRGDFRSPTNTTVFLNVSGEGNPAINFNSQDVIFTIDCSSSMDQADPAYLRRDAAKNYVNKLIPPDRAAVIKFSDTAELVDGHHLSSDYDQITGDLNKITNQGQTNFQAAFQKMNEEFINYGGDNSRICILLTDGKPEPPSTNITIDVLNESIANNITIYTIGLYKFGSATLLDEDLLKWVAAQTDGEYFRANTPNDLVAIYNKIADRFRNYTAGYDKNVLDNEPMVRDVLLPGFYVDNNSYSRKPDAVYLGEANITIMEWNVSEISIGQTVLISYNISSDLYGHVSLHPYTFARVVYYLEEGDEEKRFEVPFRPVSIWVKSSLGTALVPPPPPGPPPPAPPPPPPGGYPIPITTPASPTVIPLAPPTGLPAAATPVVFPVEYLIAGFVGLGIIERMKLKKLLVAKQKVAVGT